MTIEQHRNWTAVRAKARERAHVLVIAPSGAVVVLSAWLRPRYGAPPEIVRNAIPAGSETIGWVDHLDPGAYRAAERLAAYAGWKVIGEWTTAHRYPAVQVRRTTDHAPRNGRDADTERQDTQW